MAVLAAFADHSPADPLGYSVAEIATLLGRERSQVSRVLRTLEAGGLLQRDAASRRYTVSWEIYARTQQVTDGRLRRAGHMALAAVAEETGENTYLGVLRGDSSVTILEHTPPGAAPFVFWTGRPYPAYCSDAGQALLFDAPDGEVAAVFARTEFRKRGPNTPTCLDDFLTRLRAARRRGYSIIDEEAEPGLFSVAVPVRDFRDEVIAALQVVGPRSRLFDKRERCADSALRWGAWLTAALSSTEPIQEPRSGADRKT
jgi:DNA-binding IclR family transcriptional regulator